MFAERYSSANTKILLFRIHPEYGVVHSGRHTCWTIHSVTSPAKMPVVTEGRAHARVYLSVMTRKATTQVRLVVLHETVL